jgi:3-phenylpropionate/trans-cinnamate dioxygenase ferredoxin reductase subunit
MVAGFAAKEMVKQGLGAGELCIVSADTQPPYQRPPLSKGFLAGTEELEKVFINREGFYADSGIDLRLGVHAASVDLEAREVRIAEGGMIGFENLLFATGSSVRHVDLPGSDLEGVYYLRTLDDCKRLKAAAAKAKTAVIVGGGFIGTELAARLGELGPEVTFTYREKQVLSFFLTPELSALYEGRYRAHGVQLSPETNAAAFLGTEKVEAVRLEGGEEIAADMVAVAVGVTPDVELARPGWKSIAGLWSTSSWRRRYWACMRRGMLRRGTT